MRARRSTLFVLAAVLAWSCGSAEGAYTDGMELETAGDYAGAADAYALALERDRTLSNVAGRLAIAGKEAVARYVAQAASADAEDAADAFLLADALVVRADAVGVDVERPVTFEADRDAAFEAAVDALGAEAENRFADGDFEGTLGRLRRARDFRPSPERSARLDRFAVDAYGEWAEDDIAAGRYRAALGRVDAALALGLGGFENDLLDFRAEILDIGTVVIAVFPAEGDDDEALFLRDLSDALVDDHLVPPPDFVGVIDPAEVRRWERRDRDRRGPDLSDSPRRLGEAATDLGVDLGVVVALGPIAGETIRGREQTESATIRGSSTRVRYTVREDQIRLSADADVIVVDAGGRQVCDDTVRRDIREDVDIASYDGDWRELDLSRSDRRLFADDVMALGRDRARDRLRDALASALASRVASCVGRQVR